MSLSTHTTGDRSTYDPRRSVGDAGGGEEVIHFPSSSSSSSSSDISLDSHNLDQDLTNSQPVLEARADLDNHTHTQGSDTNTQTPNTKPNEEAEKEKPIFAASVRRDPTLQAFLAQDLAGHAHHGDEQALGEEQKETLEKIRRLRAEIEAPPYNNMESEKITHETSSHGIDTEEELQKHDLTKAARLQPWIAHINSNPNPNTETTNRAKDRKQKLEDLHSENLKLKMLSMKQDLARPVKMCEVIPNHPLASPPLPQTLQHLLAEKGNLDQQLKQKEEELMRAMEEENEERTMRITIQLEPVVAGTEIGAAEVQRYEDSGQRRVKALEPPSWKARMKEKQNGSDSVKSSKRSRRKHGRTGLGRGNRQGDQHPGPEIVTSVQDESLTTTKEVHQSIERREDILPSLRTNSKSAENKKFEVKDQKRKRGFTLFRYLRSMLGGN